MLEGVPAMVILVPGLKALEQGLCECRRAILLRTEAAGYGLLCPMGPPLSPLGFLRGQRGLFQGLHFSPYTETKSVPTLWDVGPHWYPSPREAGVMGALGHLLEAEE